MLLTSTCRSDDNRLFSLLPLPPPCSTIRSTDAQSPESISLYLFGYYVIREVGMVNRMISNFKGRCSLRLYSPGLRHLEGRFRLQFVLIEVTLAQIFFPVLRFSPVNIIPPLLHTHPVIYRRQYRNSEIDNVFKNTFKNKTYLCRSLLISLGKILRPSEGTRHKTVPNHK